ncbi:hypothetical protein Ssi02_15720 [Sinosporangium siamense]|uniref:HTH gntR-type domain-containing protein n=1 Tax=Sinosporangium siamense TaxID=1367973 RepID=A0A919RCD1_9ACTN|nr:hypothetical protein Ssi02_15720 [Sinosporangium siamense]
MDAPQGGGRSAPIYRQIADQITVDIRAGNLLPGHPIPSESELVRHYGASRATVRQAVALLREQGLVYTVRTEASYVGPPSAPRVRPAQRCERIADDILGKIQRGDLRPGDRLPTEVEMAAEYGVARNTARAAIALLRDASCVRTQPCKGTFVTKITDPPPHTHAGGATR